jgi:hypothetical protein
MPHNGCTVPGEVTEAIHQESVEQQVAQSRRDEAGPGVGHNGARENPRLSAHHALPTDPPRPPFDRSGAIQTQVTGVRQAS